MAEDKEMREITVRDIPFVVDDDYAQSYAAFKVLRKINSADVDAFEKLDLSFEFIKGATGCDESQIVELAGGESAPATDVMQFAVEILSAIDAKN